MLTVLSRGGPTALSLLRRRSLCLSAIPVAPLPAFLWCLRGPRRQRNWVGPPPIWEPGVEWGLAVHRTPGYPAGEPPPTLRNDGVPCGCHEAWGGEASVAYFPQASLRALRSTNDLMVPMTTAVVAVPARWLPTPVHGRLLLALARTPITYASFDPSLCKSMYHLEQFPRYPGLEPLLGGLSSGRPPYEAGDTVTSNSSLTVLPSASWAVTVIVAVPAPVPTTVRVEPLTHTDATP